METAIEKILLAVGPNDRDHVDSLLDEVIAVAGPTGATVYLLHVFSHDEHDELLDQMGLEPTSGALQPDVLAARHEDIRTPAHRFEELDIDHEVRGVVGNPDTEIVRVANELGVDRIVIGGSRQSPAGKAVFGNHAQQVLLNASCPVTYVQR